MGEIPLILQPDPDEPEAAEVYVDGAVDGRPTRFLLDTGAGKSCVIHDAYTATLPLAGTHASSGVFAASSEDLVVVPRLEVGPIVREDFTLVRLAPGVPRVRNLIGMDVLKDHTCHFLFDQRRLRLDEDAAPGAGVVPQDLLSDDRHHPYVEVGLGEGRANAVWDTGASLTIVDLRLIWEYPAWFAPLDPSIGTDSTGSEMETPMFVMGETTIGGQIFAPLRVAGVDLSFVNRTLAVPMDLVLGHNALRQAHWWFDFPRRQWAITGPASGW